MRLRLGTRGSALALAQSRWVQAELEARIPGCRVELMTIQTSGDRLFGNTGDSPDSTAAEPMGKIQARSPAAGGASPVNRDSPLGEPVKGLFIKEIEEALLRGEVDCAVHSAKDLPGSLPEGLRIAAYPRREDPRDAFVGAEGIARVEDLPPGAAVGTSSLRRQIQLKALAPQAVPVSVSGNVDTRLRKLSSGKLQGLVVARAGLARLGSSVPCQPLDPRLMVPAPGQGALAVEARSDRAEVVAAVTVLDDPRTRLEVECEREFLLRMGGGCRTPMGALARLVGSSLELSVFWSDPEGRRPLRLAESSGALPGQTRELAARLAQRIQGF